MTWLRWWEALAPSEAPEITQLRGRILDAFVKGIAVVGVLPIALVTMETVAHEGWWWAGLYVTFYAMLVGLVWAPRASPHIKQFVVLVGIAGIAVTALLRLGLSGAGMPLLAVGTVVAFVLFGLRGGLAFMGLSVVALGAVGMAWVCEWLPIGNAPAVNSSSASAWLGTTLVFVAISIVMMLGLRLMIDRFARLLREQARQARDLTEANDRLRSEVASRERAQEALEQSEARFRELARLLPETVFETDMQMRFTFVNQAGIEAFGYEEDFDFRTVSVADLLDPEDLARGMDIIQREIAGERIPAQEYRFVRADGTTFPGLVKTNVIRRGAEPLGLRGLLFDISKQKDLEQEFAQASKMRAVGTLAGGVAHDFNNILTGIQGRATLARRARSPAEVGEHLDTIEQCVQSAASLTRQLLGFARGGHYEVAPTDLNGIAHKAIDLVSRARKDIRVRLELSDAPCVSVVDAGQVEQVLLNLLVNAQQAMPVGGDLTVASEVREVQAEESLSASVKPGRYVVLRVRDTGEGMDAETLARVFEPFFSTKHADAGTGLGLASAYGIVRNHEGIIHAYSEPGRGAEFSVFLPESAEPLASARTTSCSVEPGRECILVVDDEPVVLDVAGQMLEQAGYRVLRADSGVEGVRRVGANGDEIALVLLDMVMPGRTTTEVVQALKASGPSCRILLSSGYSQGNEATRLLEDGCHGFIQKPYTQAVLTRKVRAVLDAG